MKLKENTINKFFYTHVGYVYCPSCNRLTYYMSHADDQNKINTKCEYCHREFEFTAE